MQVDYVVTVRARGHQSYLVAGAKSATEAIRLAKEGSDQADPIGGELDNLCWSTAEAFRDGKGNE